MRACLWGRAIRCLLVSLAIFAMIPTGAALAWEGQTSVQIVVHVPETLPADLQAETRAGPFHSLFLGSSSKERSHVVVSVALILWALVFGTTLVTRVKAGRQSLTQMINRTRDVEAFLLVGGQPDDLRDVRLGLELGASSFVLIQS